MFQSRFVTKDVFPVCTFLRIRICTCVYFSSLYILCVQSINIHSRYIGSRNDIYEMDVCFTRATRQCYVIRVYGCHAVYLTLEENQRGFHFLNLRRCLRTMNQGLGVGDFFIWFKYTRTCIILSLFKSPNFKQLNKSLKMENLLELFISIPENSVYFLTVNLAEKMSSSDE